MVDCEECGNKLGFLKGYRHPALGTKFLVCGECFIKVQEDMERWSKFCLSDSSNIKVSKIDIQEAWNKNISNDRQLQNWFSHLWCKIESQTLIK